LACVNFQEDRIQMRRALFTLACCSILFTIVASAQTRKAGLWEVTSTMSFQQSPMPTPPPQANGRQMPQGFGGGSPFGGGSHTIQICVTQAQIDKYNAIFTANSPQQRDCQFSNIQKTANGMTADMVCSGRTNGSGTIQASFIDSDHATSKIHFTGTVQLGPNPSNTKPIEWTNDSTSVFKGPDCGNVKPIDSTPATQAPGK
jgi:hypothetical protein